MQILKIRNLSVTLGGEKILQNIDIEVNRGEILTIIGPNGAGKTTLFKALLGLISYDGKITWAPNIKIGYVPQRLDIDTDIPLTVKEFFKLRGKIATSRRIKEVLTFVQLEGDILKKGLGEISVGQRQRLLVSWAMLDNPDILLFDEPTADIDIYGQESIFKTIHQMNKKSNLTVILISHDLNIVSQYATKVFCLNRKNLCYGSPAKVLTAENLNELYGGEKAIYEHKH